VAKQKEKNLMANLENPIISAKECRKLLGNISSMTLWRWLHSQTMKFPASLLINRRRYFFLHEIEQWIAGRSQ
tara:strand:- start:6706 stop:6924 length:219 start_codon:yes stop_codon:yes gene_type:complete